MNAALRRKLTDPKPPTLAEKERELILGRLQYFEGHLNATAQSLGISRTTLWRRLQAYRAYDVRPA